MYNEYFGFTEPPFSLTPDPRFSYTNALYQEAFATLRYGIEARKGFIVITGEAGTGKTTLLRRLMQSFGRHVQTAYIYNTHITLTELLRLILSDLGLPNSTDDRLEMVAQLNEYLIKQLKERNIVTLLVDEAQELSMEMLEEIRLLSNLETDTEKLLQIVLMGQPELERKLDRPELRQLKQRVALRCRLDPLPAGEVGEYIATRLKAVGYTRKDLFQAAAVEKIAAHSRGIPRLINIICDNALLIAFAASKRTVSSSTIEEVARDLRLDRQASRSETAGSPGAPWPNDTIEKVPGFRSTRASDRSGVRAPALRDSEFFMMGLEEKPVRLRRQPHRARYGTGVFLMGIVLGLAGILFYSQQMWGSLTALTDNIKEFTGKRQSDSRTSAPMLSSEKSSPDLWEEKKPSEDLPPELPSTEQQPTWQQAENPTVPEQTYEELSKSSAPVEQRRSATVARKPLDSASSMLDKKSRDPTPSAASNRSGTVYTDRDLELQVEKAIDNRALRGIAVSVRNGTAYLRGRVPTPRQRLAATRAAQSVPGVKAVDNQVSLDSEPD